MPEMSEPSTGDSPAQRGEGGDPGVDAHDRRDPSVDRAENREGGTDDSADRAESGEDRVEELRDRADEWQDKLAMPVLIAALASIPAVFLTLLDGTAETAGNFINTGSGIVLIAEAVVLFAVSEHRWQWLKDNKWLVLLAAVMIPAVVFAVGPVQLLRLVRTFGALRIIRARRIFRAGKVLRRRAGLEGTWHKVTTFVVSLLVAGFVAIVLADPSSESRQLVEDVLGRVGPAGAVAAGVLLAAATFIVVRFQAKEEEEEGDDDEADARGEKAAGERDEQAGG